MTGASSGIGRSVAHRFAAEGARVVCAGRDRERTEDTVEKIRAVGGEAFAAFGDVSTAEGADAVVASSVESLGGLDALVSNAGNRRGEQRFACKLGAEVYSTGTSVPNRATLSDISEGGCYVEMPSPIDGQSGVEILVRTADTKFKIKGEVLTTHPGFGMGVRFLLRNSAQREEILRLLGVLAVGPSIEE